MPFTQFGKGKAMQTGYFTTAWQDVRNTQGWIGKLLLLALLMFIPVFGWIVVMGYLLGWARDVAWGVHGPMPVRIFGNEDGKLYSRGFFAWLIGLVFAIIPAVVFVIVNVALGVGTAGLFSWHHGGIPPISYGIVSGVASMALVVVLVVLYALAMVFSWIGWMRMSVYGRLSAGFQFERIWTMLRHDTRGAARIFGMYLIVNAIIGIVSAVVVAGAVVGGMVLGIAAAGAGVSSGSPGFAVGVLALLLVGFALLSYAAMVVSVFCVTMVVRAMGYWVRQFDVPHWRGQDDPMPFELGAATR